jgi:hypothetical protein
MASWLATPVLAAVVVLVLAQPERDFWPDRLCLMAVMGTAAIWHLRDVRLTAAAAAFAMATCYFDLGPPAGPEPLAGMATPRPAPPPSKVQKPGGEQAWVGWRAEHRRDAQRRLLTFIALNAAAFLGLLAVAARMGRRAERSSSSRRRIEPLPVLAIEEGVNGKFGARSRKESWGRWRIIGW